MTAILLRASIVKAGSWDISLPTTPSLMLAAMWHELAPVGLVKFGLAGKDLWQRLDPLRDGPATRAGVVPVRPDLVAGVKFFGRYRSGAIRDGVLHSVG
jgi:hypothetical protein